ncbi:MAG TPA: hypothetical protein VGH11_10645 [Jatrophihabitans sp.]|jgi:uncharacterized membrane protein YgcG
MSETTGNNSAEEEIPQSAAARLFDIRVLIGSLFTLYGVMLIVAGFFTSKSQLKKASNININLWLGIGMLVLGLLFLLWWKLNPIKIAKPGQGDSGGPSRGGPSGPSRGGPSSGGASEGRPSDG